jgi:hypothetical protein
VHHCSVFTRRVHQKLTYNPKNIELWGKLVMALQAQGAERGADMHVAYQEIEKLRVASEAEL